MKPISYTCKTMRDVAILAQKFPQDVYDSINRFNESLYASPIRDDVATWAEGMKKYVNDPYPIRPFKVFVRSKPLPQAETR